MATVKATGVCACVCGELGACSRVKTVEDEVDVGFSHIGPGRFGSPDLPVLHARRACVSGARVCDNGADDHRREPVVAVALAPANHWRARIERCLDRGATTQARSRADARARVTKLVHLKRARGVHSLSVCVLLEVSPCTPSASCCSLARTTPVLKDGCARVHLCALRHGMAVVVGIRALLYARVCVCVRGVLAPYGAHCRGPPRGGAGHERTSIGRPDEARLRWSLLCLREREREHTAAAAMLAIKSDAEVGVCDTLVRGAAIPRAHVATHALVCFVCVCVCLVPVS